MTHILMCSQFSQSTSRTVYPLRTHLRNREMESKFLSYPLYPTSFDIRMNYFPLLCFL